MTDAEALNFGQKDAEAVYDELRTLFVPLDGDPLSFGPKRLNQKVAETRRMLDRCERIFLDVSQRLYMAKHKLRQATTILELSKQHLFANDPEVRAGRAVSEREALAVEKLRQEVETTHTLELLVQDLDSVLTVVKAKRSDLRDTQGRLREQIRLCQEEIGLGGRWGSKVPGAPELQPGQLVDMDGIADIVGDIDGVIHAQQKAAGFLDDEDEEETFESLEEDDEDSETSEIETEEQESGETETETDESEGKSEKDVNDEDPLGLEDSLPATSSEDEVESFLEDDPVAPLPAKKKSPRPPVDLDVDLDDVLANFEDPDS